MRLDMVSGKVTMYFDGAAMGSYTEPDPATSLVELSPTAAGYSHVNFDYVTASSLPASTTPDFSLSGNPSHLILAHGSSATGDLTLNSINGFSGTVTLQTHTDTAGLRASVSPSTIFLSSPSRATLSVSASSTALGGRYNVTISGTSGQASHSFTVSVFTESNPYVFRDDFNYVSMKEMLAGGWTTSGGFPSSYTVGNGLLTLSQNTYIEADPNTYLNSVGPGSSALSTDSFDYITASEPSTPYFGFGASPSPLIVISQRSGNTTILVDSRSGFTGNVSLTATGPTEGPSV